ncbi:unnamed protein product, partial [Ceratitis capitata]
MTAEHTRIVRVLPWPVLWYTRAYCAWQSRHSARRTCMHCSPVIVSAIKTSSVATAAVRVCMSLCRFSAFFLSPGAGQAFALARAFATVAGNLQITRPSAATQFQSIAHMCTC